MWFCLLCFHLYERSSKDIPRTSTVAPSSDSSTDRASSPDVLIDLATTAVSEDVYFTDTTGINSGDHDPQEPDSQRASDIHTGHTPQRTIHSKYGCIQSLFIS